MSVRAGGSPWGLLRVSTLGGVALSQGGSSKWSESACVGELRVEGREGGVGGNQRWFLGWGPSNQVNTGTF